MEINNWDQLIVVCQKHIEKHYYEEIFNKLIKKIQSIIKTIHKSTAPFDYQRVDAKNYDIFLLYKITVEQLLLEDDIIDIFSNIHPTSMDSNNSLNINLRGRTKWIKLHLGNVNKLFHRAEESIFLVNKSMANVLNKLEILRNQHEYFGAPPKIYLKVLEEPSQEIIDYFEKINITILHHQIKTPSSQYYTLSKQCVLLDRDILFSLCAKDEQITRDRIDAFISDKQIIIPESIYDKSMEVIFMMTGKFDVNIAEKYTSRMKIVPDIERPKFSCLKNKQNIVASVAESNMATIITGNSKFHHRIVSEFGYLNCELFVNPNSIEE